MLNVAVLTGLFSATKKCKKTLNRCFRQEKSARKVGEVCSVASICNPQTFVNKFEAVSNMQYDLQPGPNGISEPNLNAFQTWIQVGIYMTHIDPTRPPTLPPIWIVGCILLLNSTDTHTYIYDSRSHKLENVLKCEWNGHFHHDGISLLVQLTRWWCCYFTLTSNDHRIAIHPVRFC